MLIEIQTDDRSLSMPFDQATKRDTEVMPGVIYEGLMVRKAQDMLSDALRFIVDTSINVEWGLLSAYLYEKVKGRQTTQIRIKNRIVEEMTPEGFRRTIEQEITGPINKD